MLQGEDIMKLKLNIWTGIMDIVNSILFVFSWFAIAASAIGDAFNKTNTIGGTANFFVAFAAIGLIMNITSLVRNKKYGISLVGPILGVIGNGLYLIMPALAFPAIVVLIVATVFTFLQKSTNQQGYQNYNGNQDPNLNYNNYQNQNFNNNQNYQNNNFNNNQNYPNNGYNNQNGNPVPMTRSARHHR